jgi:hypothetical protein
VKPLYPPIWRLRQLRVLRLYSFQDGKIG